MAGREAEKILVDFGKILCKVKLSDLLCLTNALFSSKAYFRVHFYVLKNSEAVGLS